MVAPRGLCPEAGHFLSFNHLSPGRESRFREDQRCPSITSSLHYYHSWTVRRTGSNTKDSLLLLSSEGAHTFNFSLFVQNFFLPFSQISSHIDCIHDSNMHVCIFSCAPNLMSLSICHLLNGKGVALAAL